METLAGAFQVIAAVVLVGGVAKVASPVAFSSLLRTLGIPGRRRTHLLLARVSGVVEILLASAALAVGGAVPGALLAAAYVVFTLVTITARNAGATSCGCFGAASSPPNSLHVTLNAVSAALAVAATMAGAAVAVPDSIEGQPIAGVAYVALLALATWLTITLNTTGAEVMSQVASVSEVRPKMRTQAAQESSHLATQHRGGDR